MMIYRTRIHKDKKFWKNLLKNKEIVFENGVRNIQAAAYNGARTVLRKPFPSFAKSPSPTSPNKRIGSNLCTSEKLTYFYMILKIARNVIPMVDTLTYITVHFTVHQWKEGWFHQLNLMIGPQKLEILDLVILILLQVKADLRKNFLCFYHFQS